MVQTLLKQLRRLRQMKKITQMLLVKREEIETIIYLQHIQRS